MPPVAPSSRTPWGRAWRLGAALLATLLLLELASGWLFRPLTGEPWDAEAASQRRRVRMALFSSVLHESEQGPSLALHPYLGYAGRPGAVHPHVVFGNERPAFNAYGFLSARDRAYPSRRREDALVLGVLGGSVAEMFANTQEAVLTHDLRELVPGFDRQVVMINLAAGGYKQPQQLFGLEWALLLGFEFDAVVNLDGFNDLALAADNAGAGVHPLYPSAFHVGLLSQLYATRSLDPATVDAMAEYFDTLRGARGLLARVEGSLLGHSRFASLVAELWARRAEASSSSARYRAALAARDALPEALRGPPLEPFSRNPRRGAARAWAEASRMVAAVCAARGLPYLHVLQPNQYVPGSKPLSEEEERVAVKPDQPWGRHARVGYRFLRAEGRALRESGVAFYDLTGIFRDRHETVYADDCCHLNGLGNRILSAHLARILERELGPVLEPGSEGAPGADAPDPAEPPGVSGVTPASRNR